MAKRTSIEGQLSLFPELEEPQLPQAAPAQWPAWPKGLWVGTSSWSFPGWAGLVYDRKYPESRLAREGLSAYAHHPLLRAVGIDRSYYAPVSLEEYTRYAAQVPDDFRFLVKAPQRVTAARLGNQDNPDFLSARLALEEWVEPARQGLGSKLGCLLLQFPPLSTNALGGPAGFATLLHRLLEQLPGELPLAVEIRNRDLFCKAYVQVLQRLSVSHSLVVHPSMPPIAQQFALVGVQPMTVVRWMLGRGEYEEAVERYQPFNRLVDEDPSSRTAILDIWRQSLQQHSKIITVVNNKAEGCSPKSIERLCESFWDPDVPF
ncbi:DUF72 domain-containing protein [bacterium]|nr:DUF72 domain-containing protein [bacterium]